VLRRRIHWRGEVRLRSPSSSGGGRLLRTRLGRRPNHFIVRRRGDRGRGGRSGRNIAVRCGRRRGSRRGRRLRIVFCDGELEIQVAVVAMNVVETIVDQFNLPSELFHGWSLREFHALGPTFHQISGGDSDSFPFHVRVPEGNHVELGLSIAGEDLETTLKGVHLPL